MAKRKNPILPTLRDLEALVRGIQAEMQKHPNYYYNEDYDEDGYLADAQEALYEKMKQDYVDTMFNDPLIYDELTSDLPDDRDTYSDYALDNFVAESLEESFRQDNGDPSDLDLHTHYAELVAASPDLENAILCPLTVGASGDSKQFNYQTGDNSYTGGAYGYPHWAVTYVGINSNPKEVAKDIQNQISELWHGSNY